MPKTHYVATYGRFGLNVEFFSADQSKEYKRAVKDAEREHRADELDSYTNGEIS